MTYEPRLRGGSLIAYATTDPENEEVVYKTMREVLLRIAAGPNTYRDCRSAVNAAVGMYGILNQDRAGSDSPHHGESAGRQGNRGISKLSRGSAGCQRRRSYGDRARRIFNMEKAAVVKMHGRSN